MPLPAPVHPVLTSRCSPETSPPESKIVELLAIWRIHPPLHRDAQWYPPFRSFLGYLSCNK